MSDCSDPCCATAWQSEAACRGLPKAFFFVTPGGDLTTAKAVCESCPVQAVCLIEGLRHHKSGIWGGTTDKQRRVLRKVLGVTCTQFVAEGFLGIESQRRRCGTDAGWQAHYRNREVPCDPCVYAHRDAVAASKAKRKRANELRRAQLAEQAAQRKLAGPA